ncbi:MAG: SatD family protein [bacterium]
MQLNKNYFLLLIDIKKSTSISSSVRQKVFNKLDLKLKQINQKLNPKPALGLSISYGDEIAGLFDCPRQIYEIVNKLRQEIYPEAQLRFVVAYGKIGVISDDIRKVGGEIFKEAENQMNLLKKQDGFSFWSLKDSYQSSILNSLTEMSNAILERMTPYQRQVWQLLESGLTQKQISERLKKYPQSVSDAAKRGEADLVLRAGRIINQILEKI